MKALPLLGAVCAGATLTLAAGTLVEPYAGTVVSLVPGLHADFGVEDNMLGAPVGGGFGVGSNDVYTLGLAGEVVLELQIPVFDGPGSDFLVCENPFIVNGSTWDAYVELMTVEVSSDGNHWVPFPTDFDGPVGPYLQGGLQLGTDLTDFDGFAGVLPVFGDLPAIDDQHVVATGGDAFDLADVADHPLVLSQDVDLQSIRYVRLTDVVAGVDTDSDGQTVWDCGHPSFASADVDAVVGLNTLGSGVIGRPEVELTLDDSTGLLILRIADEDGLYQIKNGLSASINSLEVPFVSILPFFVLLSLDGYEVTFVTGPVPPGFERTILKVAAEDLTGLKGGDAIFVKE